MSEQRRMTIRDVAREAGVSVSTASLALTGKNPVSEQTRQKVLAVAERLKYRPNAVARSLVTRRTKTIGLILSDIADPYFHEVTKGVEAVLSASGFSLILANTDRSYDKERLSIDTFQSQQAEGLIIVGSVAETGQQLADAVGSLPCVVIGRGPRQAAFVNVDNEKAGELVTTHLIETGRRTIVFVKGPRGIPAADERLAGFRRALARRKIEGAPDMILTGDFTPDGGFRAAAEYLSRAQTLPDAIVAANDQMAIGVLKAVRQRGLSIPHDLAVAGVGDIPPAFYADPPLTTVRLPLRDMGEEAGRLLLDLIDGKQTAPAERWLDVQLIIRQSTASSQSSISGQ